MNFLASAASGHGRRAGEKIFGMDVQRFGQRCSGRQGEGADVVVRFFVGKNTFRIDAGEGGNRFESFARLVANQCDGIEGAADCRRFFFGRFRWAEEAQNRAVQIITLVQIFHGDFFAVFADKVAVVHRVSDMGRRSGNGFLSRQRKAEGAGFAPVDDETFEIGVLVKSGVLRFSFRKAVKRSSCSNSKERSSFCICFLLL